MDVTQPPPDNELRKIIDKLAQFVARNGPEFENMTKTKQKGNPRFNFLYGGDYYSYYQYKVAAEEAALHQSQTSGQPNSLSQAWNVSPQISTTHNNQATLEYIIQQQEVLKEQIRQSEQNLTAQHSVLLQQQQAQFEVTLKKVEEDELRKEAEECQLDLDVVNEVLQPIIDSCTKDSISNGKAWILANSVNKKNSQCIAHCLLLKATQDTAPFSQKLHIIYLVNDVLHHCARKHADELKKSLEHVVVPMFCNTSLGATNEQRIKLDKLLKLWESKANYLQPNIVQKLRHPSASYQQYKAKQVAKYAKELQPLVEQTKTTFENYQSQHQAFVGHAMQQILVLQQQKDNLDIQATNSIHTPPSIPKSTLNQPCPDDILLCANPPAPANIIQQSPNPASHLNLVPSNVTHTNILSSITNVPDNFIQTINPNVPPPIVGQTVNLHQSPSIGPTTQIGQQSPILGPLTNIGQPSNGLEHPIPFTQPPPAVFLPPGVMFPDFTKPPPGFSIPPKPEKTEEIVPAGSYYDLPAGLMIPLIKLEDYAYKPLDPTLLRIPPPATPNERLIAAVEAFYTIPCHDRPRDSDGWEKLGLYEYFKAKNTARKLKEEQIQQGLRERSRSPSPIVYYTAGSPAGQKRTYQSRSPTPLQEPILNNTKSPARSRSPSRKRRSRSKRRHSVSPTKSLSTSPIHRSPTPPNFVSTFFNNEAQEIDESNKGHQMLRKMGWGGSGLGAKEQGIDAPISGGDVRDRQDQFKGVGMNLNDPYENFRKNKGAAFITRMKARAEERAQESKGFKGVQAVPD